MSLADEKGALEGDDLERLATTAYLVGREDDALALWRRLFEEHLDRDEPERAARWGGWLSLHLLLRGDVAQSSGWLSRSRRLLGRRRRSCVGRGYLELVPALMSIAKGDVASAWRSCARASALGERFGDRDLSLLGLLGRGQTRLLEREIADGVALLDEAMIDVTAGAASPIVAGIVYCAVILSCNRIFDVRRAREWTAALDAWCASQPDLVPFRGRCRLHRAEVLQLEGRWQAALEEAKLACERLGAEGARTVGEAHYRRAELHRLRGEVDLAERAYRDAAAGDVDPQPGVALLRLARGDLDAAEAAIRLVVERTGRGREAAGAGAAPDALAAYVEIMLAKGRLEDARTGAEALARRASEIDAPMLQAMSAQSLGAVRLAEGDAEPALALLRDAWARWQRLDAPYESARVRLLVAAACRDLGDRSSAELHGDAARAVLERLGARLEPSLLGLRPSAPDDDAHRGLTTREREVLALVASGKTNRSIAAALFISEHTVARHLSNIFHKIGVTSRTAASAFAFEHDLVR